LGVVDQVRQQHLSPGPTGCHRLAIVVDDLDDNDVIGNLQLGMLGTACCDCRRLRRGIAAHRLNPPRLPYASPNVGRHGLAAEERCLGRDPESTCYLLLGERSPDADGTKQQLWLLGVQRSDELGNWGSSRNRRRRHTWRNEHLSGHMDRAGAAECRESRRPGADAHAHHGSATDRAPGRSLLGREHHDRPPASRARRGRHPIFAEERLRGIWAGKVGAQIG
jgi:hypothetical protein